MDIRGWVVEFAGKKENRYWVVVAISMVFLVHGILTYRDMAESQRMDDIQAAELRCHNIAVHTDPHVRQGAEDWCRRYELARSQGVARVFVRRFASQPVLDVLGLVGDFLSIFSVFRPYIFLVLIVVCVVAASIGYKWLTNQLPGYAMAGMNYTVDPSMFQYMMMSGQRRGSSRVPEISEAISKID